MYNVNMILFYYKVIDFVLGDFSVINQHVEQFGVSRIGNPTYITCLLAVIFDVTFQIRLSYSMQADSTAYLQQLYNDSIVSRTYSQALV